MRTSQMFYGKALDSYCPMGPAIVDQASLGDAGDVELELYVNGELRQRESTAHMLFSVPVIIAETGLPPSTPNSIGSFEELHEELARIRRQGYAVDNEEREEGLRCIAVPVRDAAGDVVAAISIAGPSGRVDNTRIEPLVKELWRISDALGVPHGAAEVMKAGDPEAGERASSGVSRGTRFQIPVAGRRHGVT